MNTHKPQSEESCHCSILSSYENIQKQQQNSPKESNLKAVKLKILEKLIKENKCPAGHTFECFCDRELY